MKKIFYGGAFDPLTLAHERIIRSLHDGFRGTLIVAVTNHDYKQSWKPIEWRMEAVTEYCESLCFFNEIKVVEQDCRTCAFLEKSNLNVGTIVVGMDEWKDLNDGKWQRSDELLAKYNFLVVPRANGISSTAVRNLVNEKASDEEILKYVSVDVCRRMK